MSLRRFGAGVLLLAAAAATSGCAHLGVKPWERDLLADKAMDPGAYPLERAADDHTYFSKEAATGGSGYGGGGCGCN